MFILVIDAGIMISPNKRNNTQQYTTKYGWYDSISLHNMMTKMYI